MAITEEWGAYFNEFARPAIWTPAAGGGPFTIDVIFDNAFRQIGIGEAGAAGRDPRCLARDDQLAQSTIARGDTMVINGVTYKVATHEPDGTGATDIELAAT